MWNGLVLIEDLLPSHLDSSLQHHQQQVTFLLQRVHIRDPQYRPVFQGRLSVENSLKPSMNHHAIQKKNKQETLFQLTLRHGTYPFT